MGIVFSPVSHDVSLQQTCPKVSRNDFINLDDL